jgi:hypothetical protein
MREVADRRRREQIGARFQGYPDGVTRPFRELLPFELFQGFGNRLVDRHPEPVVGLLSSEIVP